MSYKERVHKLINEITSEIFSFIRMEEDSFEDGWVPSIHIKESLDLNFISVPQDNIQYGKKGWFFAIIARKLEDKNLVEYKKENSRAFYRTIKNK